MNPIRQHITSLAAREIGQGDRTKYFQGVLPNQPEDPNKVEWCGIFLLWVLHQAGVMPNVKWEWGRGFLYRLPQTTNPQPGDLGYKHHLNHQNMVVALDEDPAYLWTIDGNSTYGKVTGPNRQRKSAFAAFFSIDPVIQGVQPPGPNWGMFVGAAVVGLLLLGGYVIGRASASSAKSGRHQQRVLPLANQKGR
jgi:hypothetical protein